MNGSSMPRTTMRNMRSSHSSSTQFSSNQDKVRHLKKPSHLLSTSSCKQQSNDSSRFETTSSGSSSTPTTSSPLPLIYWVGGRTRLPLYVLSTSARTVDMGGIGLPNALNGSVLPVTPGDLVICHRTVPTMFHPSPDDAPSVTCALCPPLVDPPPDQQLSQDQFPPHSDDPWLIEFPLSQHFLPSLTVILIKKTGCSCPLSDTTTPLPPTPLLLPIPLPSIDPALSSSPPQKNHPLNHSSALYRPNHQLPQPQQSMVMYNPLRQ